MTAKKGNPEADDPSSSSSAAVMPKERRAVRFAISLASTLARMFCVYLIAMNAYEIRLFAINTYGRVIHEFDPWFNFRATQYLADNGWTRFFQWYDYKSWYPLGRPVGTTIYPGMQIFSVALWRTLNYVGVAMSLNDVCCFVPAWLGATASMWLGLLAAEASGSNNAGVVAMSIFAIIPAHIMRSVGGGYDNECVAMSTMCMTFYFWVRSLRNERSWPIGIVAGLAYICMVATWGGYIFIVNMIGVHAAMLVVMGRYSDKLYRSYTLFFAIGTFGATHVPVVGWAPLRNLEQIGPAVAFVVFQLIAFCHFVRRRRRLNFAQHQKLRIQVFGIAGLVGSLVCYQLFNMGYFGPLGARIRGLFVKHTRTGNPLVDSVAEHQPASDSAYWQYMQQVIYAAPVGLGLSLFRWKDGQFFLVCYGVAAYYFANKMVRLIVIAGPIASTLSGVSIGYALDWALAQISPALNANFWDPAPKSWPAQDSWVALLGSPSAAADAHYLATLADAARPTEEAKGAQKTKKTSKSDKKKAKRAPKDDRHGLVQKAEAAYEWSQRVSKAVRHALLKYYNHPLALALRLFVAVAMLALLVGTQTRPKDLPQGIRAFRKAHLSKQTRGWLRKHDYSRQFIDYSWQMAEAMSSPSIMFKAKLRNGKEIIVDDYREAYWWLRDNTPEDARVMAWWDYGYQISGIGNRTTIADGNTWNHEHIATLGKALTSDQEKAHKIVRHLADYLLVWTGGGGDDLAKSPHMARIGNSVYRDICPGDPTCSSFGFYSRDKPTPMMRASLLYNLHGHNQVPGVTVNPRLYEEAFTSRYNKVRIFKVLKVSKKSKLWVADPANRVCDAPGSWYCSGQYPPALTRLIASRRDFSQLENFNKGGADKEYTEAYMARMEGRAHGSDEQKSSKGAEKKKMSKAQKKKQLQTLAKEGCIYGGVSYGGPNVDRVKVANAVACLDNCEDDFACSVWTYQPATKVCRLKGSESLGRLVLKQGYVSGAAQCNNEDVGLYQSLVNPPEPAATKPAAPKPAAPKPAAAAAEERRQAVAAAEQKREAAAAAAEERAAAAAAEQEREAAAAAAEEERQAGLVSAEEKRRAETQQAKPLGGGYSLEGSEEEDEDESAQPFPWANTPDTTRMWQVVNGGSLEELQDWIEAMPDIVHIRSEDGRGPLWWAYEYGRGDMVQELVDNGVDATLKDAYGKKASEM